MRGGRVITRRRRSALGQCAPRRLLSTKCVRPVFVPFRFLNVVRLEAEPQRALHDAVGSRSGELTELCVCLRPCYRVEGSAVVHSAELSVVEGIIRFPTEE